MEKMKGEHKALKDLSYKEIVACKRPENMWQVFQPDDVRPLELYATANVAAILIMIAAAASVVGLLAFALWSENALRDFALNASPLYETSINVVAWSAKVLSAGAAGTSLWRFWKSIPFLVSEIRRTVQDERL
ncbi:hypothetical protein [Paraburkholderia sp. J8-2]|uniref:hypothetical protein n=1 Tax=Paraburkholderia sp. J8-2 TaxID=2805440 RepID=UPI002AB7A03D|nr:hypothetical protein [Paraburkholderia sp. J8-2]